MQFFKAGNKAVLSMAIVAAVGAAISVQQPTMGVQLNAPSSPTVTISGFAFSNLSVKAGTKFTVKNKDNTDHTFHVAGTKLDPMVKAGASVRVTAPTKPGKYKVTCDFHPSMHGVLTVSK